MKKNDKFFKGILSIFTFFSISLLFLVLIFIIIESLPFFKNHSIIEFISGKTWRRGVELEFGLLPIILASVYTSFLAILFATPISLGLSLLIVGYVPGKYKKYINNLLNILAGVPSVIYGFLGLTVIVKLFEEKFNLATGESVLAGGILLALMIIPYITSVTFDKMEESYQKYNEIYKSLGLSKDFFLRKIIIKDALKNIIAGVILGLGRAFGETMAVMMVIGNAPIMPTLLSKGQTIPSLIALEMGMVELNSMHYHSLYAAGLVLMLITILTNILFSFIVTKGDQR